MKHCVVCASDVEDFLPYKQGSASVHPVLHALRCVGSDVDHFHCPRCGCFDRERHLLLYLSAQPRVAARLRGGRVLHFAPERHVSRWIEAQQPASYLRADLVPRTPGWMAMSLEHITLPDASVDVLLANHVLEHVADDVKALREVSRVLRPGGLAVLQTPYSALLPSTLTEAGAGSATTRDMIFGEPDHLRLYGHNVFEHIACHGLRFVGGTHADLLPAVDAARMGVNAAEPLFLFER
jgi:SAM-dependent methyltransferase